MKNKIVTSTEEIELCDDGIILCTVLDDVYMTLEEAKENIRAVRELNPTDNPCKVIVDIRKAKGASRESRQYFSGADLLRVQSACAMIVESRMSVIIGNFFIGINKTHFPLKLFKSVDSGREWLLSLED